MDQREFLNYIGLLSSIWMMALAVTHVLKIVFTLCIFHTMSEIFVLAACSLLCMQGEVRIFGSYNSALKQNFGFCYEIQGRAWIYLLVACYSLGYRSCYESGGPAWQSSVIGTIWYAGSALLFFNGFASLYVWKMTPTSARDAGQNYLSEPGQLQQPMSTNGASNGALPMTSS